MLNSSKIYNCLKLKPNLFSRRYGTKCSGCGHGISPSDLVRKAREKVFHLNCFTCLVCRKQLSTGEELYVLDDNKFICKEDYLAGKAPTHCKYQPKIKPTIPKFKSLTPKFLCPHKKVTKAIKNGNTDVPHKIM